MGFSLQCFSCCRTQAPGTWASAAVAHGALERGLSSCVTEAQLRYGACSLLTRDGTRGRFPSTALLGKSQEQLWFQWFCIFFFFILHGFPYLYCFIHSTLGLLSFSRFLRQKLRSFILVSFLFFPIQFSLVAQSCPTLCDPMDCSTPASLSVTSSWSLLRLSLSPCSLSPWCHPTISSSIVPFSSHLQSFPASGSFPMRWFLESGGQSIVVTASASVFLMNIQDWFPLGWTGWISLQSKGLSRVDSNTTVQKHKFFGTQLSL